MDGSVYCVLCIRLFISDVGMQLNKYQHPQCCEMPLSRHATSSYRKRTNHLHNYEVCFYTAMTIPRLLIPVFSTCYMLLMFSAKDKCS